MSWGIVGYRYFTDKKRFNAELKKIVKIHGMPSKIVSGGAPGADTLAKEWASENKITFVEHLPKKQISYEFLARNTLIVNDSTLVIAFLSKESKGTHDTINKAKKAKKQLIVINID